MSKRERGGEREREREREGVVYVSVDTGIVLISVT